MGFVRVHKFMSPSAMMMLGFHNVEMQTPVDVMLLSGFRRFPGGTDDAFDDVIFADWFDSVDNAWWTIGMHGTTDPGKGSLSGYGKGVLLPGFYHGLWSIGKQHVGTPYEQECFVQKNPCSWWEVETRNDVQPNSPIHTGLVGCNFHRMYGQAVGTNSLMCQGTPEIDLFNDVLNAAKELLRRRPEVTKYNYKLAEVAGDNPIFDFDSLLKKLT